MEIYNNIIEIFLLGVIGGAVPGPMLTAIFTETLNSGFKKGFRVVLRALLAEILLAAAILLVVFSLNVPQFVFHVISILGSGYLVYLAIQVWQITTLNVERGEIFPFYKMLFLTLLSGAFWIFWITVCVPRAFSLKEIVSGGQYLFVAVFELGWLAMTIALTFVFSRFRPLLLKKNLVTIVFKFFAILLIIFAIKAIIEAIIFFL